MSDTKYDVLAHPKNEMKFNYGGQAVIEGVMMRGQHVFAVAVRAPDGSIAVHEAPLNKALYRGRIPKMPFVRGIIGLWDALGLGTRALMWSADIALQEEEAPVVAKIPANGAVPANAAVSGNVVVV
ncbi:MAG TPA: DUF1385 domain-containing protein, partial [Phototrophicaceae bacterium]|nr:DUF1385 domain-containing protein [Phototrophicaceae bacterium]